MSASIPSISITARTGAVAIKDGLSICFYLRHSHQEVATAVLHSLDAYLQSVGNQSLTHHADEDGSWRKLDDATMARVREELSEHPSPYVLLTDRSSSIKDHQFLYRGVQLDSPESLRAPGLHSCAVSFWLPTRFIAERGADAFRKLASSLAELLPYASGHAGPSFHSWLGVEYLLKDMFHLGLRYPGMDIPDENNNAYSVGEKVQGVHWLNFLGPPVLNALGGAEALAHRLRSPGTSVLALGQERALLMLGSEPDAGDMDESLMLPAHRELASVLEPQLASREVARPHSDNDALRRWEHRFLPP
jgi:hypothetical protein